MNNDKDILTPARDEFERYYTEKIWDWIPAVYKDEDGLAAKPDVLRSIVQILSHQAAIARRSIDRLWDDQFIELCDDWAVAYIGDLVGTRLVHELNRRGRRVDVARTIFYRRRKGTPRVLEILIQDITGWEGTIVESFRRLTRTRHGLDPEPAELEGFVTDTPPGGWAKLKSTRGAELVDGPFDEFFHTPDFRQLRGRRGRYNIPKLNLHLLRLLPFEVNFATAANFGERRFTFDPSGRDIPLFRPDQKLDPQKCRSPREWELPAPILCRLLGEARYMITAELIKELVKQGLSQPAADELSRYVGVLFRNEARLRETMESLDESVDILDLFDKLLAGAITENSPKAHLIPSPIQTDPSAVAVIRGLHSGEPTVEHQRILAGNLEDWGASLGLLPPEKVLVIDPERGRFLLRALDEAEKVFVPLYHYGLSGPIGAGTYDRRLSVAVEGVLGPLVLDLDGGAKDADGHELNPGPIKEDREGAPFSIPNDGIHQFVNSKTYHHEGNVTDIHELTIQAANFQRPYVKRILVSGTEWIFQAAPPDPDANQRLLTFEGLWIGIEQEGAAPAPAPCLPVAAALVLQGEFDRVVIRHCTLDPGGEKARIDPSQCQAIPYVRLLVSGKVEELIIESSIVGPIVEDKVSGDPGIIQKLIIRDSIVQSIDPTASPAIDTELGQVELQRVTVFGGVTVNRLFASEALIQGLVRVTDNQHGCFRFSATNDDPQKRLPPQFEWHFFAPKIPNLFFVSRRLGDPGYAQLSETAPESIIRGAENRSEIGAFSSLLNPIKLDDLKAKVNEFMPFGLIGQYINET